MKNNAEAKVDKTSAVRIDKSLNKYSNVVLFPKKVEMLKKDLEKFGIPDFKNFSR